MGPRHRLVRLCLAWWLLAAGSAAAAEGPRIAHLRPLEDLPLVVAEVEYPKAWPDTGFTFEADGRPVPSRAAGGGYDQRSKQASYLVFPGASFKQLVARWGGGKRTASFSHAWAAPTLVVLLGRLGEREALLEPGDLEFQVFPPAKATFLQDEVELPATPVAGGGPGRRVRIAPRWSFGPNTIHVLVTTPAGPTARSFTFVPLPQGFPLGQTARLVYGEVGSKSGPFHELSVEGQALGVEGKGFARLVTADRDGWIGWSDVLVADLAGKAAGDSTLSVSVKPNFLGAVEPGRPVAVRVVTGPPEPPRGGGLAHDPVENDPRYAEVFAKIDAEVDALLKDHPSRGSEGFCHVIWATKKGLLKERYGIEWRSPDEMNPHVIFD